MAAQVKPTIQSQATPWPPAAPVASSQAARPPFLAIVPLFVALIIGAASIGLRLFEFRGFAPLPTGFDGPLVFRQRYLLEHGAFLFSPIPIYSYWSGVVNAQLGSYVMELISALVLVVAGWIGVLPRAVHQAILTLLLSGLGLSLLWRGRSRRPGAGEAAIVVALLTMGTPVVINFLNGWNVAYAWALLLAVTLVYVSRLPLTAKLLISVVLTFLGPPLYHSFGFLLTTYIVVLWFLGGWMGFKHSVASPVTVGVYYLTYQIYVSTVFFGALVKGLMDVMTLEFLRRDAPVIAVSQIDVGLINLQQLHILLYGLLAIPVALAGWRFARLALLRRRGLALPEEPGDDRALLTATVSLAVAIGIFAVMFGLKFSLEFLINRGASYMIVATTLAVIYELRRRRRWFWYVAPLTLVAVALSLYSFHVQSRTVHLATHFTHEEAEGYAWMRAQLAEEDVVFTDFRLSGAFIADGHFRVLGITGEGDEPTDELLERIYYSGDARQITATIDKLKTYRDGQQVDYLFLSTLMMDDYPGLNGYSSRFAPAPQSFFDALDGSADWKLRYENESIRVYERAEATP
jgi:hypothetical protein